MKYFIVFFLFLLLFTFVQWQFAGSWNPIDDLDLNPPSSEWQNTWSNHSFCINAFSSSADQQKCQETYNSCIGSSTHDRCVCRAIGGISLNTNVPFVGSCISMRSSWSSDVTDVDPTNAFPLLMAWLSRIVMTVILIFCFMAIIVGGVLISSGWASDENVKKGKDLIRHVVIAIALLGASGVILRAINPNFFG